MTCWNIIHVVGLLSRYIEELTNSHLKAALYIFLYLNHKKNVWVFNSLIIYSKTILAKCFDADFRGDWDEHISASGYVSLTFKGAVAGKSRKPDVTAASSVNVEYVFLSFAAQKVAAYKRYIKNIFSLNQLNRVKLLSTIKAVSV